MLNASGSVALPEFVEFEKFEGLGNDFVVVDASGPFDGDDVVGLCDRHFGIGADGVLVIAPPTTSGARARMIVQNADGSRPEMCGNGLRCVALGLAARDGLDRAEYSIDTDAGLRRCEVSRQGDRASVLIDMGRAEPRGELRAPVDGIERAFQLVSVGNPHAVVLDVLPDAATIDRYAPGVSQSIPGGANIEFVAEHTPGRFDVVVWERGVGRTLACGTGAAAVASVLARAGRIEFGKPAALSLPGGLLELSVAAGSFEVRLRGPARRVFGGKVAGTLARVREST
jgi:diaminopimelate epimerase